MNPSAAENYVGSPNAGVGLNNPWGATTYWTSSIGSPPPGWLNGPGGTAAANEWPTTGSNLGAVYLKPHYPMLDAIEIKIPEAGPGVLYPTEYDTRPVDYTKSVARREGLRGTEISGTWKLLLSGDCGDIDDYYPLYFKQVRLEITYEEHGSPENIRMMSQVRPGRRGNEVLYSTTGVLGGALTTASFNVNVSRDEHAEISRTFGIGLNTGSMLQANYALLYRLTGTLADISGTTPGWLLDNEFGMPRIPISSASLVEASSEPIFSMHPQDILTVRPLLDGAQRLSDAARDAQPVKTRAEYAAEISVEVDEE